MSRRRQRGFTLIELLIAVTLAAALLVMLSGGMFLVMRDWERSGDRFEQRLDDSLLLQQVEVALQGAYPHSYQDPKTQTEYVYFEGDVKRVSWASTVSPGRQAGLYLWRLLPGEDGGLRLELAPLFPGEPEETPQGVQAQELLPGYQVGFEYLYIDPYPNKAGEPEREWRQEWSAKELYALPSAVRVRLQAPPESRAASLELVAPIAANRHFRLPPRKPNQASSSQKSGLLVQ